MDTQQALKLKPKDVVYNRHLQKDVEFIQLNENGNFAKVRDGREIWWTSIENIETPEE